MAGRSERHGKTLGVFFRGTAALCDRRHLGSGLVWSGTSKNLVKIVVLPAPVGRIARKGPFHSLNPIIPRHMVSEVPKDFPNEFLPRSWGEWKRITSGEQRLQGLRRVVVGGGPVTAATAYKSGPPENWPNSARNFPRASPGLSIKSPEHRGTSCMYELSLATAPVDVGILPRGRTKPQRSIIDDSQTHRLDLASFAASVVPPHTRPHKGSWKCNPLHERVEI